MPPIPVPQYAIFPTEIGPMGIAWAKKSLLALQLPDAAPEETLARLRARLPDDAVAATVESGPPWLRRAVETIRKHLAGDPQDLAAIPLQLDGLPDFRRRVYQAAQAIAVGQTVSYAELAVLAGSPGAFRAVGTAMRQNPFAILIPCHRVIGSGGKAGGYSAHGGLATKKRLLALEGAVGFRGKDSASDAHADAVRALTRKDAVLGRLMARVGACRLVQHEASTPFEVLLSSVVHQQLNGTAARTILGRVKGLFGDRSPTPAELLAMPDERLRGAGLSTSKTASLKDLAARTAAGEIPDFAALSLLDDEQIVEKLTQVRGIGRWTVEMLLIFRMGRPDVLPVTDFGVRKGFAIAFKKPDLPTPKELTAHGERWRPHRSVASWYLWRATEL